MFDGITNLMSLLQNAHAISDRIQSVRDELKTRRVTGSAGGGMVQVEVNGLCEVLRVKIDPQLLQSQDHEMLEDLLPAAINQAFSKARELHLELAKTATRDLSLPGLEEALSKLTGR